jgi:hypothetical protein
MDQTKPFFTHFSDVVLESTQFKNRLNIYHPDIPNTPFIFLSTPLSNSKYPKEVNSLITGQFETIDAENHIKIIESIYNSSKFVESEVVIWCLGQLVSLSTVIAGEFFDSNSIGCEVLSLHYFKLVSDSISQNGLSFYHFQSLLPFVYPFDKYPKEITSTLPIIAQHFIPKISFHTISNSFKFILTFPRETLLANPDIWIPIFLSVPHPEDYPAISEWLKWTTQTHTIPTFLGTLTELCQSPYAEPINPVSILPKGLRYLVNDEMYTDLRSEALKTLSSLLPIGIAKTFQFSPGDDGIYQMNTTDVPSKEDKYIKKRLQFENGISFAFYTLSFLPQTGTTSYLETPPFYDMIQLFSSYLNLQSRVPIELLHSTLLGIILDFLDDLFRFTPLSPPLHEVITEKFLPSVSAYIFEQETPSNSFSPKKSPLSLYLRRIGQTIHLRNYNYSLVPPPVAPFAYFSLLDCMNAMTLFKNSRYPTPKLYSRLFEFIGAYIPGGFDHAPLNDMMDFVIKLQPCYSLLVNPRIKRTDCGPRAYAWSFFQGLNNVFVNQPLHQYPHHQTFLLTLTEMIGFALNVPSPSTIKADQIYNNSSSLSAVAIYHTIHNPAWSNGLKLFQKIALTRHGFEIGTEKLLSSIPHLPDVFIASFLEPIVLRFLSRLFPSFLFHSGLTILQNSQKPIGQLLLDILNHPHLLNNPSQSSFWNSFAAECDYLHFKPHESQCKENIKTSMTYYLRVVFFPGNMIQRVIKNKSGLSYLPWLPPHPTWISQSNPHPNEPKSHCRKLSFYLQTALERLNFASKYLLIYPATHDTIFNPVTTVQLLCIMFYSPLASHVIQQYLSTLHLYIKKVYPHHTEGIDLATIWVEEFLLPVYSLLMLTNKETTIEKELGQLISDMKTKFKYSPKSDLIIKPSTPKPNTANSKTKPQIPHQKLILRKPFRNFGCFEGSPTITPLLGLNIASMLAFSFKTLSPESLKAFSASKCFTNALSHDNSHTKHPAFPQYLLQDEESFFCFPIPDEEAAQKELLVVLIKLISRLFQNDLRLLPENFFDSSFESFESISITPLNTNIFALTIRSLLAPSHPKIQHHPLCKLLASHGPPPRLLTDLKLMGLLDAYRRAIFAQLNSSAPYPRFVNMTQLWDFLHNRGFGRIDLIHQAAILTADFAHPSQEDRPLDRQTWSTQLVIDTISSIQSNEPTPDPLSGLPARTPTDQQSNRFLNFLPNKRFEYLTRFEHFAYNESINLILFEYNRAKLLSQITGPFQNSASIQ